MDFTNSFIKIHSLRKLQNKSFKIKKDNKIKLNKNQFNLNTNFFKSNELINNQVKILESFSNFNYDKNQEIDLEYYNKNITDLKKAFKILENLSNINSVYYDIMEKIIHIFRCFIFCDKNIYEYYIEDYKNLDLKKTSFAQICFKFKNREFELYNWIHKNNGEYEYTYNEIKKEMENYKNELYNLKIEYDNLKKESNFEPFKKEIFDLKKQNQELNNLLKNKNNTIKDLNKEKISLITKNEELMIKEDNLIKNKQELKSKIKNNMILISNKNNENDIWKSKIEKIENMNEKILFALPKISDIYINNKKQIKKYEELENFVRENEKMGLNDLTPRPNYLILDKEFNFKNLDLNIEENGKKISTENILVQILSKIKNGVYKKSRANKSKLKTYKELEDSVNSKENYKSIKSNKINDKDKKFNKILSNIYNFASKIKKENNKKENN